jgi:hypothetical protein
MSFLSKEAYSEITVLEGKLPKHTFQKCIPLFQQLVPRMYFKEIRYMKDLATMAPCS